MRSFKNINATNIIINPIIPTKRAITKKPLCPFSLFLNLGNNFVVAGINPRDANCPKRIEYEVISLTNPIPSEESSLGIKIPEEIAVIGFDNDPMGIAIDPELTTVEQPVSLMAEKALQVLLSAIHSGEEQQTDIMLDTRILRRKSC